MNELNNPAARLHSFLKKGQLEKKEAQSFAVWAKLLNTSTDNVPLLMRRISYVMELPAQIEREIHCISDINHDIHLRWLSRANAGISITEFHAGWNTFIGRFNAEIMYGIEVCADTLSRYRPEKEISESQLANLIEKLQALEHEFAEQQLSFSIQAFIQDRFTEIRMALEEVQYRGVKPLENVIETTIGKTAVNPSLYHESKNSPFGNHFWEYMGYLAVAITITTGSIQIGKDIVNLLPSDVGTTSEKSSINSRNANNPQLDASLSNIIIIET